MFGRFMNTMYALLGCAGIVLSAYLLAQHQYVVLTRKASRKTQGMGPYDLSFSFKYLVVRLWLGWID